MELLETQLACPRDGEQPFPCGPRSQGGADAAAASELRELLEMPALSALADAAPAASVPALLRALHAAAAPHAAAYGAARLEEDVAAFVLELRAAYRALRSPGKRPWPVLLQAAADARPSDADCDALHALTRQRVIGADASGAALVGAHLAGAPLCARVLRGDGAEVALLQALPAVAPVPPGLRGAALRRACHDVACATRVAGAAGLRRMTRDEQVSEVARRSAEVTAARRACRCGPAAV